MARQNKTLVHLLPSALQSYNSIGVTNGHPSLTFLYGLLLYFFSALLLNLNVLTVDSDSVEALLFHIQPFIFFLFK